MGEREEILRRRRQIYEQMRLTGQRLGPLQRLRIRRRLRQLVSAPPYRPPGGWRGDGDEGGAGGRARRCPPPPYGPPGGGRGDGDEGGAGVREPRRPLPRSPQGAAELPRDPAAS